MEKIKERIAKLLRLSMSENEHEAKLAAEKAVELMQRYALSREDVEKGELASKTVELDFARVPIWIRELYSGMACINGCYMVWIDGRRGCGRTIEKRARIVLTGRESDLLNVEYLLHVFIREIEKRSREYSSWLGNVRNKRKKLRDYRLGLGSGLVHRIEEATQRWEKASEEGLANAPVPMQTRYEEAKAHYRKHNDVRTVTTRIDKGSDYLTGWMHASDVALHRPVAEGETALSLPK